MVFYILDHIIRIQQSHTPVCFWNWCESWLLSAIFLSILSNSFWDQVILMALFFRLQFFQLRHLLPLPASPRHSLWCCSSTLPPYLTELCLPLMGNHSLGHPLRGGVRGISVKICLTNRCPRSFSSTGISSSWQALALRASSPGALLGHFCSS